MQLLTLLTTLYTLIHTTRSKNSREEEFSRIQHYELIEINTNAFESAKIIDFIVFNQYYKIQLIPNEDLIPSKLRHASIDIHNTPEQQTYFKSLHETCHYFGKVLNSPTDGTVALSLCPKRGIRGRITAFNQTIFIKPSAHYFDFENAIIEGHSISDQVLIYKSDDFDTTNIGEARGIKMFSKDKSIIKANDNVIQQQRRRLYSSSSPAKIELLIINGPERTKRFQTNYGANGFYSALYNDIADIVNSVSADYSGTNWGSYVGGLNSVKVVWVELEIIFQFSGTYYTLAPNWLRTTCMTTYAECAVNGRSWLTTISSWIYQNKQTSTFDNVQLISDIEFSTNTAGWGNVGQVCKGSGSVSDISEQWGHDYVIKTLAHELGHNLGMSHDVDVGCNGQSFIMGSGYDRFSSCSISAMQQYMQNTNGLTCLSRHQSDFTSNYNDNNAPPPTNTPVTQPTPRPTTRPTTTDSSGDWTCFGMRNINGIPDFNGMWAQSGTYGSEIAYYLNGYYLYFHTNWNWWLIGMSKGSTSVKGYCQNANLQACAGGFKSLASTGWVTETSVQIFNCGDNPNVPTARPTVRPTVRGSVPTTPPPTTGGMPCTYYSCLRISSMALDSDGRSYNGDWTPSGCHNGQSYYELNGQSDRKLCYSSYNMWMISEGLCPTGRTIGYSPEKSTTEIIATKNNWNILEATGWDLDTGVTLTPCNGDPFIDRKLDCENEYSDNLCIYSNNTLWNGHLNFELHPSLCSKNRTVYKYVLYNETNDESDKEIRINKTYNNINIINTYYLHYYQEPKYSDGNEMIGKWIITQNELTLKGQLAICEKDNLIECTENEWIVDRLHEGEETEGINGTDFEINDGWFEKVIDKYMTVSNNKCKSVNEEMQPEEKYNLFMVIVIGAIGILILIGCVIGCFLWNRREKKKLRDAIHKVSMGTNAKKLSLSDQSDDENEGGCNNNTNGNLQLNETQMIEVDVEIEDDHVGTPLNATKYE